MHFVDLVARMREVDFPSLDDAQRPAHESVRALQHWVSEGLGDGEFAVDCIELELASIGRRPPRPDLEPFFVDDFTGARFALAYWAPGRAAGAHEHNDWTVTAVCHNRLEVQTYDLDVARARRVLEPKNLYRAERGQAGHIYDSCIHNPYNPTTRWAVSIHVVSPHDGPLLEKQVGSVEGLASPPRDDADPTDPLFCLIRAARHQRTYRALLEMLVCCRSARACALIEEIYRRGDLETRRIALSTLSALHPSQMDGCARELAATEVGADTALAREWPSLDLSVRRSGSRSELFSERKGLARVLLRLDGWAEETLQFAATTRAFRVGDLPGKLSAADRTAVARALIDVGLFHVTPVRTLERSEGANLQKQDGALKTAAAAASEA